MAKPKNQRGLGRGLNALFAPTAAPVTIVAEDTSAATMQETPAPAKPAARAEEATTPPAKRATTVIKPNELATTAPAHPEDATKEEDVLSLPIEKVHPNPKQPRQSFDEASMDELTESVRTYGILQPILVRAAKGGYEIVAGERRYRAAKEAGLLHIPAIVRTFRPQDMAEVALIENVQREDLNVIEEAQAYHALMTQYAMTQEQLAAKIGRSRSHIANILRLLALPPRVQESLVQGVLLMGQAKPILSLESADLMERAADYIAAHGLSSRESEVLAAKLKKDPTCLDEKGDAPKPAPQAPPLDVFLSAAEDHLKMMLGAIVHIKRGAKKSQIVIDFKDEDDLSRILGTLEDMRMDDAERKKELLRAASRQFSV